jgi:hypothetical protein
MTRLVVVKIGDEYLRFSDDGFQRCTLGKASVFAETEGGEVRRRLAALGERAAGARLMLLTITEQPYGG